MGFLGGSVSGDGMGGAGLGGSGRSLEEGAVVEPGVGVWAEEALERR